MVEPVTTGPSSWAFSHLPTNDLHMQPELPHKLQTAYVLTKNEEFRTASLPRHVLSTPGVSARCVVQSAPTQTDALICTISPMKTDT